MTRGTGTDSYRVEMSNGTRNFKIPGKKERLIEIFRTFSVPFDFEPGFLDILVEWNAPVITCNALYFTDGPADDASLNIDHFLKLINSSSSLETRSSTVFCVLYIT